MRSVRVLGIVVFALVVCATGRPTEAARFTATELVDALRAVIQVSRDAETDKKCIRLHDAVLKQLDKDCPDAFTESKVALKVICKIAKAEKKCRDFPETGVMLGAWIDALVAAGQGREASLRMSASAMPDGKQRKVIKALDAAAPQFVTPTNGTPLKTTGKDLKKGFGKLKKAGKKVQKFLDSLDGVCPVRVVPAQDRPVADINGGGDGDVIFANYEWGSIDDDPLSPTFGATIIRVADCRKGQDPRVIEFIFDAAPMPSSAANNFFTYDLSQDQGLTVLFYDGNSAETAVSGEVGVVNFNDGLVFFDATATFVTDDGNTIETGVIDIRTATGSHADAN